jgi:hypothetical protein
LFGNTVAFIPISSSSFTADGAATGLGWAVCEKCSSTAGGQWRQTNAKQRFLFHK